MVTGVNAGPWVARAWLDGSVYSVSRHPTQVAADGWLDDLATAFAPGEIEPHVTFEPRDHDEVLDSPDAPGLDRVRPGLPSQLAAALRAQTTERPGSHRLPGNATITTTPDGPIVTLPSGETLRGTRI